MYCKCAPNKISKLSLLEINQIKLQNFVSEPNSTMPTLSPTRTETSLSTKSKYPPLLTTNPKL